jgi:hypothetical protein
MAVAGFIFTRCSQEQRNGAHAPQTSRPGTGFQMPA